MRVTLFSSSLLALASTTLADPCVMEAITGGAGYSLGSFVDQSRLCKPTPEGTWTVGYWVSQAVWAGTFNHFLLMDEECILRGAYLSDAACLGTSKIIDYDLMDYEIWVTQSSPVIGGHIGLKFGYGFGEYDVYGDPWCGTDVKDTVFSAREGCSRPFTLNGDKSIADNTDAICHEGPWELTHLHDALGPEIDAFCQQMEGDWPGKGRGSSCVDLGGGNTVQLTFGRAVDDAKHVTMSACSAYLKSQLGCQYGGQNIVDGWEYNVQPVNGC